MRKGLAAAGAVALISVAAGACGSESATPQDKVGNAFEKLADSNTVTLGLGFDGTADQIYAALKGEDDFTRDDATLLSSLRVSLAASSQKSFSLLGSSADKSKDSAFAFTLSADGQSKDATAGSDGAGLVEIRYVDQKAYLRFDLKGLAKLSPTSSTSTKIDGFLAQSDQLPSSLASVKAALNGHWVSLDPKAFKEFGKSLSKDAGPDGDSSSAGDSPLGVPTPSLNPTQQRQVVDALKKALSHNVTYKDLGNRDGADHVQVSVPAQQFVKDSAVGLEPVLKQLPGISASDLADMKNAKDVPNKTLSVDVALKDGKLSAVTFDVAQLDTGAQAALPLTLTFKTSAASITAPKDAAVLNPQDIMGLVMSSMPGGDDSTDPTAF